MVVYFQLNGLQFKRKNLKIFYHHWRFHNGPGTHLEDDGDFKEFINEYSDIYNHKKSMAVYITMKEITIKKRGKESDQKENEISDSESVDVEVIDDFKKIKTKTQKTSDLDDSQIKGFTTIDEPLTYPIFGFDQKKSQHIQINPSESQVFYPPPYHSNHVYQYYAPNMYQNYTPTLVTTNTNDNNINNSYINVKENISIQEFFENLDKKFGDKVFSVYLKNFLDQCIEVQHIPE
ncbi:hypothetical protein RclHR1_19370006 [Rhizophagus clarus]|uniref:Uncharacterized protein n=1 Tax=Rhizophagus clarus TaxID=94130 RepID=A0A2Z6QR23_9GLOM|nr:hypothetical protein RclHR1_19370006 [Rhizophagus clarus]